MPTVALQGALRTPVRPDPVRGILAAGPRPNIMTAAQGLAPARLEPRATVGPIQPLITSATRSLTAREYGRSEEVGTTDGTWCGDFTPELMIELR